MILGNDSWRRRPKDFGKERVTLTGAALTCANLGPIEHIGQSDHNSPVNLEQAHLAGAKLDGIKGLNPDKIASASESASKSQRTG